MTKRENSLNATGGPESSRLIPVQSKKIDAWAIARHAGVGKATVARVLSGNPKYYVSQAMRERVMQAARELGYVPNPFARSLRSKRSHIIGISAAGVDSWAGDHTHMTPRPHQNHHLIGILENLDRRLLGIRQNPMASSYRLMLISLSENDSEGDFENRLLREIEYIDGLIYLGPHQRHEAMLQRLASRVPLVVEQGIGMQGFSTVSVDLERAMEDCVRLLHGRGSRQVGLIVTVDPGYLHNVQRINAFKRTLASLNLPFQSELIVSNCNGERSAHEAVDRMLRMQPRVDGLIVPRDPELVGAMDAIRDSGLVFGRDIRLISLNETEVVRTLRPTVTAVQFPYEEVANQSVFILMRQIDSTLQKPTHILIPATLNERETTLGLSRPRTRRKMAGNNAS